MMKVEEFSIAQLQQKQKKPSATMHDLVRSTLTQKKIYDVNDIEIQEEPINENNSALRLTSPQAHNFRGKNKENKNLQKNMRVKIASANNLQVKNNSSKKIPSIKDIESLSNQSPLDEIRLENSQNQIEEALTTNNIGQNRNNILKNNTSKSIKSLRNISVGNLRQQKQKIKSTKSIKFNDKKDVFTYKSDNKLNSKKKIKSFRRPSVGIDENQDCCQII